MAIPNFPEQARLRFDQQAEEIVSRVSKQRLPEVASGFEPEVASLNVCPVGDTHSVEDIYGIAKKLFFETRERDPKILRLRRYRKRRISFSHDF